MKTLAITVAIAALLCWFGPSVVDHSGESAAAQQAIQEVNQQARFERAAQHVCGENAGWIALGNGAIQCKTHRGHNTFIAEVQP